MPPDEELPPIEWATNWTTDQGPVTASPGTPPGTSWNCAHCGVRRVRKPFTTASVPGALFCEKCRKTSFFACITCKTVKYKQSNLNNILVWRLPEGETDWRHANAHEESWCNSCLQGHVFYRCRNCEHHMDRPLAVVYPGIGQRHTCQRCFALLACAPCGSCGVTFQGCNLTLIDGQQFCPNCSSTRPIPDTSFTRNKSKLFVGFELEFIYLGETPQFGNFGHVKGDSSIKVTSTKGGTTREFASRIARGDALLDQVTAVCAAMKASMAYANRTCGFHVHIDMRFTNEEKRTAIRNWWLIYEPIFFAMVRQQRRKNSYCVSVKKNGSRYDTANRYQALNTAAFAKHKSYEFRLHHGTVNRTLIINWIRLLLLFVECAITAEPPTPYSIRKCNGMTGRELLISFYQFLGLPLKARKYVVRRIRRFEKYTRITEYIQLAKKGTP